MEPLVVTLAMCCIAFGFAIALIGLVVYAYRVGKEPPVTVKFKLHRDKYPYVQLPQKATDGSAGYDLVAMEIDYDSIKIGFKKDAINPVYAGLITCYLGFSVEIPKGYVAKIYNRSSCYKTGTMLANCVGVIDSDYRGEVKAIFFDYSDSESYYKEGDRIAQLIIEKLPDVELVEVSELSETERGGGGFGSTGK